MKKNQSTQNKNPDLEQFQNSQAKLSKRTRFFSLSTYLDEKKFRKVIQAHIKSIRAFCYILHDKDDTEPHTHIVMRTHSAWTSHQILRWFDGFVDADKKPINTLCEPANDLVALKDYLIHSDAVSRKEGKHLYSFDEVHDFGIWDMIPQNDSYDDTYEILNKLLVGTSYREMVRQYGRKFLYHWGAYSEMADKIRTDEGYHDARIRSMGELLGEPNLKEVKDMEDFEK